MNNCGFSGKSIRLFVALGVALLASPALCEDTWLLDLAKKDLGTLSKAEEKLFLAVGNNRLADFIDPNNKEANDPNSANKWGPERTLNAERVEWAWAKSRVQRMEVRGAKIEGKLCLAYKKPGGILALVLCAVSEGIVMDNAQIGLLNLEATHCGYINAPSIVVDGGVDLTGIFLTKGGIILADAKVGTNLLMDEAHIESRTGYALVGDRLEVGGNLSMGGGFLAIGQVSLSSAKVGNHLNCRGASFINEGGIAIRAQGIKVEGTVKLGDVELNKGFEAKGEVWLTNGQIRGDLVCTNAQFVNEGKKAFVAQGIVVEGNVIMRKVIAKGEVDLQGGVIGGWIECLNCVFLNKGGFVLIGEGLNVKRTAFFSGFSADGMVNLHGAEIGGVFSWRGLFKPEKTILDLEYAHVGTLLDDPNSWPGQGRLFLDGFTYGAIHEGAPIDAKERIGWLHRQPRNRYRPQPYEQLAKVLRESGHDEEARQILIAKKEEWRQLTPSMPGTTRFWGWMLGWLMDYGYHPLKIWRAFLLIPVGWIIFFCLNLAGLIRPCQAWAYRGYGVQSDKNLVHNYPRFNSLLYSIDVFIPLVKLHQMNHWLPKRPDVDTKSVLHRALKGVLYLVLWVWIVFETVAGWVTLSMLIAGLTLLIRS